MENTIKVCALHLHTYILLCGFLLDFHMEKSENKSSHVQGKLIDVYFLTLPQLVLINIHLIKSYEQNVFC